MQISIIHTGFGIPSKDMPLLFTRFFHDTNAIEEETLGTGLGLFIVRVILVKHKAKIQAKSELGMAAGSMSGCHSAKM